MNDTGQQERAVWLARIRRRIEAGASEYGDKSIEASPMETIEQLLEEVEDIAGWSFVMWVQLRRRLEAVAKAAEQHE